MRGLKGWRFVAVAIGSAGVGWGGTKMRQSVLLPVFRQSSRVAQPRAALFGVDAI